MTGWYGKYKGQWHLITSFQDTGISAEQEGGGNYLTLEGVEYPLLASELEELSFTKPKVSTIKVSYKKWSSEDEKILKETFIDGRQEGVPHKQLFEFIADELGRTPSEVQRKLIRMYKNDDELRQVKQESWSREKILDQLKELYLSNQPMNKNQLPNKLRFTILKVVPPTASGKRIFFDSVDHALAEAAQSCGYCRNEDGTLDRENPLNSLEEALNYIRLGHKKRHIWNLDEVKEILATLNRADYPITIPFLTNHYNIYKNALGINRKLESFKDVVKKFVEDGSITSYADLICGIAPDYVEYYNPDRSRLKLSTEEIRVKKFLDRYKIAYAIPRLSDKLPTGLETFANFVPDFVLLNNEGKPHAIVEVFGSIGDRENAGVNKIYGEKTKAKIDFYNAIPDMAFIDIHNNSGRCDLDDTALFDRFGKYVTFTKTAQFYTTTPSYQKRIEDLKQMVDLQCTSGNWDFDPYMHGMANGMIYCYSLLENVDPQFLSAPDEWLNDKEVIQPEEIEDIGIEDLIASNFAEMQDNMQKYGCSIVYNPERAKKYTLISLAEQNLEFDSLFEIPKLTPKNKSLKAIIDRIIEKQKNYDRIPKNPAEQHKDYQPRSLPTNHYPNQWISHQDINSR